MANPASLASGTQTATIGTEHSLTTATTAGTYVYEVDLGAMADGDVVELRLKQKLLSGGTSRVVLMMRYYGAQPTDDAIVQSIPVPNVNTDAASLDFTLKQTFGTGRAFPWRVVQYV